MPTEITNYQCPACTGPLRFVGASGKLECEYCGSSFQAAEIQALYAEKEHQAAQAGQEAESQWDTSGICRDWGAEAAAILARLKAQLVLREKKGCEYVCTVGEYWLMQYADSGSVGLALYEPLTGKLVQTVGLWKAAQVVEGYAVFDRLLSGSDGMYVWGRAGLYKRSGNTLEQIVAEPVLDFCWYGDNTLYYLSWDDTRQIPAYSYAAAYFPCASRVMKLENPGQNAVRTILAERDESSPTQNLTDIYVEYGTLYVAGSYCMGIADLHAALYEVKDGKLAALFGEY